jgi:formylglycine-generating enzyme required for sulfatase activity
MCSVNEPSSGGRGYDFTGNLQEWTSTPVTLKSGTGASISAPDGSGNQTLTGLSGMLSSDKGGQIVISAGPANDIGTFNIVNYVSASSVVIFNPSGSAGSGVTWRIDYYKIRGGNFTTTTSGGDSCEFDFDIQRATFVNNNVGFRCCSDAAP